MVEKNANFTKPISGTPRVTVTRQLMPSVEKRLSELFDAKLNKDDKVFSRNELIAALQNSDVLVPTVTDRLDADLISKAGKSLKLIANFGSGTDHIDLEAAQARNIIVTNTPGVFTDDTADIAMAGIIGVPRRIREGVGLVRSGKWSGWAPSGLLGRKLKGKTLGIVGMGRIGQAVAHRALGFGLRIIYFSRRRIPQNAEKSLKAEYFENLDHMMQEADILSLHCPMTEETRGIISQNRIKLMKPGSAIINTARGELIDQEALIEALQNGHIAGAGLDVYPNEPNVDRRLLKIPNVMTLPHIGSATAEGREASGEKVIANIRFWMDGHRPPDQVLLGFSS